jgi:DNA-binding transcriptional LysR family regulator
MDLNRAALFVRVVEAGSFTAAAGQIGSPKSSVSRGISQLEDDLGVRLLQRTTRKLALTDAGQTYYEQVRGAVAGLEDAAAAARELGAEPRGLVRMTMPPEGGEGMVGDGLAEFCRLYPGIRVEVVVASRRLDLVAENIDLAIRAGELEDSTLVVRRIGTVPLALFAAPSLWKKHKRPRHLKDLAKLPCVLYRGIGGRLTWRLTGPDGDESVEVSGNLSVDDMPLVRTAAIAGTGVALLPMLSAVPAMEDRALERILPEHQTPGGHFHVVLPSKQYVPARVALLRDFLVDHLTRKLEAAHTRCQRSKRKR